MFGQPSIDPTGCKRDAFRAAGGKAASLFFASNDLHGSLRVLESFCDQVQRKFGEHHPDIGRVSLLTAIFNVITKEYELAEELSIVAVMLLKPLGTTSFDYRAAISLRNKLSGLLAEEFSPSPLNPLIGDDPAGHFLADLKPK